MCFIDNYEVTSHIPALNSEYALNNKLWYFPSLVPRPPPFLPSVCVHNNTRERKTDKKRSANGGGLGTRLVFSLLSMTATKKIISSHVFLDYSTLHCLIQLFNTASCVHMLLLSCQVYCKHLHMFTITTKDQSGDSLALGDQENKLTCLFAAYVL